jgi:hypothetical protein
MRFWSPDSYPPDVPRVKRRLAVPLVGGKPRTMGTTGGPGLDRHDAVPSAWLDRPAE